MATVNGIDVVLSVDYPSSKVIGCARSINFEMQRDMIETSITGSGNFRTFTPGAASFTGSIEGLVLLEAVGFSTISAADLYNRLIGGAPINAIFYEQDKNGQYFLKKECVVYIDSVSESASFDNVVTFSCTFKGTGEPTITYGEN